MNTKAFFVISVVLLICGCSQSTVKLSPVSGILTRNGKPLTDVRLEFVKADTGAYAIAETDEQGRFVLRHSHGNSGAEPGTYHVSVFRKGKLLPPLPGMEEGAQRRSPEEPILMSDKSPIEVVVTDKGPNDLIIDIK